ncbi:hypothetical protein QC761_0031820 [Podospora bellae-mahoneyi]|uniref:Uncharacterized protein n=1 Tax=Podospora bellae-mahoneyi TaxID=2093777 RepID=A0ABR0FQV0_9PEZI|nr:hypothetical protein QC761_0031820 [Podospora bellae-mahoneyi]
MEAIRDSQLNSVVPSLHLLLSSAFSMLPRSRLFFADASGACPGRSFFYRQPITERDQIFFEAFRGS